MPALARVPSIKPIQILPFCFLRAIPEKTRTNVLEARKCITIPHKPFPSGRNNINKIDLMADPRMPKKGPKKYPMNKRGRSPGDTARKMRWEG